LRADSYFAEGQGKGPDLDEEEENEKYNERKRKKISAVKGLKNMAHSR